MQTQDTSNWSDIDKHCGYHPAALDIQGRCLGADQGNMAFGFYINDDGVTIGTEPGGAYDQINPCHPNTGFLDEYFITLEYGSLFKEVLIGSACLLLFWYFIK